MAAGCECESPQNSPTSTDRSDHEKNGMGVIVPWLGQTVVWRDITKDFMESVKELGLGELLHDNMFGLFEAMSAIEMMDPKMDAGVTRDLIRPPRTYDQLVESGALKLDGLIASEIIGIVDATLACFVSWLEGHSLAQTVFTNLYLHRPAQVQDRTMRVIATATHKLVDVVKELVNRALVFEEEDFQTVNYGFKLTPEVSDSKVFSSLRDLEDELHKKMRSANNNRVQSADDQSDHEEQAGVHARVRFFRMLYQALLTLSRGREAVAASGGETTRLLSACADTLSVVRRTSGRGIAPSHVDALGVRMLGFDPLVNQRLLPPTFPRYTRLKSRQAAFYYLELLIARLKHVTRIIGINSYPCALDFVMEFSRQGPCILSRSVMQWLYVPLSTTYSPQTFKQFGGGSDSCVDVLKDAARAFIAPPALQSKSPLMANAQAREYVDSFMAHCVRPFGTLLQVCGHNRARQRDKLAQLLDEMSSLQDEAERVDAFLHTLSLKMDLARQQPHLACFGTWVLYYTLRIMIMYLLSGLELELYSTHEYHYIFWYLYEFLYGWLVSALSRANTYLMEQEAIAAASGGTDGLGSTGGRGTGSGSSRNSKRTKLKKKQTLQQQQQLHQRIGQQQPFGREMAINQALQNMCGGYYKAMTGFRMEGKITRVHPEFDNEQVRYEHRFAAFASLVTPPPVQYAEFRDTVSGGGSVSARGAPQFFLDGCKHFHHARSLLENLPPPAFSSAPMPPPPPPPAHAPTSASALVSSPSDHEVQELVLICKTNFVVLKLLADGHKKDSKMPPNFDFKNHPHFPIIRIV